MLVEYSSSDSSAEDDADDDNNVLPHNETKPLARRLENSQHDAKAQTTRVKRPKTANADHRVKPPPLPREFMDLYTNNPKVSADSGLHEGRVRVIPHIEGAWPSHVFVEWIPSEKHRQVLHAITQTVVQAGKRVQSLVMNELGVNLNLHISLTPTLMVPSAQKQAFEELVTSELVVSRKQLELDSGAVYTTPNEIGTRTFIVVRLDSQSTRVVHELMRSISERISTLGLPTFKKESFTPHVSIAWYPDSCIESLDQHQTSMHRFAIKDQELKKRLERVVVPLESFKVKIGNATKTVNFV